MKPPRRLKVGHLSYTVEVDAKRCREADVTYGQSDMRDSTILLSPEQSAGQLRDTMLHEVLHCVMDQTNIRHGGDKALIPTGDDEERLIHALSPALLAVLRDNPRLIAFLLES